jgi:hypothetical protein
MALRPSIWHFGLKYGTSAFNMARRPQIRHFGLQYGTSASNMALRPHPRMTPPSNDPLAPALRRHKNVTILQPHQNSEKDVLKGPHVVCQQYFQYPVSRN